ncbi:hypothetical protein CVT25_014576 [Psilocybe cyanescens]|uniref:Uncharacterized protein n=1 Tax=Psilocybe cyanescens TaxID=93625 RepID=A0A409WRE0_PSICY|nr:hypothetical protein CVT25_014576 [Psilocybe cyanescens]
MKSFVNILTFIALATFTSTTFVCVSVTPVAVSRGVQYLQKRVAASMVVEHFRPTADVAQDVENTTGTDKSQANVGPLSTDSSSVLSTAQKVTNAAHGVENSAGTTGNGDSTVSVAAPSVAVPSDASDKVAILDAPRAGIPELPASGPATQVPFNATLRRTLVYYASI